LTFEILDKCRRASRRRSMAVSRIEQLHHAGIIADPTKMSKKVVDVIEDLTLQEFQVIITARAKISDPKCRNQFDAVILDCGF
jgi:hypothetical protein